MNSEPSKLWILQIYKKLIYWLLIKFRCFKNILCLNGIHVFKSYLKCFQKVEEIIQLTRFNMLWKIKKSSRIYQEQSRESKREQDTTSYPGSPFHNGYVQSLTPL